MSNASNIARVFAAFLITFTMVIGGLPVSEEGSGGGGDSMLLRTPNTGSESPAPPPASEWTAGAPPALEEGPTDASAGEAPQDTRAAQSWQLLDELEEEVWMPAGGWHHVGIDGQGLALEPKELPADTAGLSDVSLKAVARAPEWLRGNLADKLMKLSMVNYNWRYWGMADPSSPTEGDIDGDGDLDIAVSGGDHLPTILKNVGSEYEMRLVPTDEYDVYISPERVRLPNWPSLGDIDADGDSDLIIGCFDGVFLWENIGSGGTILFDGKNEVDLGISRESDPRPDLGDLDSDGDLDLVIGDSDGSLTYYENTGTPSSPTFTRRPLELSTISVPSESHPALGDMDGDGDLDLTSGSESGDLYYFENWGSPSQALWSLNDPTVYTNLDVGEKSTPSLADLDGDGRVDLLIGDRDINVWQYMNIGTTTNPEWFIWSTYQIFEGIFYYSPDNNLKILDQPRADRFASVIANAPQDRYVDEIAFSIAHMPVELLRLNHTLPVLFTENARGVYGAGDLVEYADVVDHGSYATGDYYSTVKYWTKTKEGAAVEVEYPRDIYYWQIVHPKITDEDPTYIDPDVSSDDPTRGVAAPPDGKWWRTWLMEHADASYPPDPDNDDDGVPDIMYPRDENPPLLNEKLAGIQFLYDNVPYTTPRGYDDMGTNNTRDWGYRDHAVEVVSNWVEKTLPINEQESADGERPIQPVRIQETHNGNCGELADLTVAGARTALIPAENVGIMGEDHTWIEFWDRGGRHWDNFWSDAGSLVDQENYYFENWGGRGKSGYTKYRADDYVYDITPQYIPREHLSDVSFTVVDSSGDPVDGARVFVATWWAYESGYIPLPTPLPSIWNYTDANGQCSFTLGNGNFTFHAVSKLGTDSIEKIYLDAGREYEFVLQLGGDMPYSQLRILEGDLPTGSADADYRVDVRLTATDGRQYPPNPTSGNTHPQYIDSALEVQSFFADDAGLSDFTGSLFFNGYDLQDGDVTGTYTAYFTEEELAEGWSYVINNKGVLETRRQVLVEMSLYGAGRESPIARISQPAPGERFPADTTVDIEGVASDNDEIAALSLALTGPGVDETVDLLPYLTDVHWSYSWDTSALAPGSYMLRLGARDNDDRGAWHNISVTLFQPGAPLVEITTPGEDDVFSEGEFVTVNATVSASGNVTELALLVDSTEVASLLEGYDPGTGAVTGEWDTLGYEPGEHLVEVRAGDDDGHVGSAGVTVMLEDAGTNPPPRPDKEPPSLMILAPKDSDSFEQGEVMVFTGTATDDSRIAELDLYIDSKRHDVLGSLSGNIWEFEWDTSDAGPGGHTARLEGVDEHDNSAETEVAFDITEKPEPEDTRSPDVEIDHPHGSGAFDLGLTVVISGTATDDIGVVSLEVREDSVQAWTDITKSLDGDGGFTYSWDTAGFDPGSYLFRIRATDASGKDGAALVVIELIDVDAPSISSISPGGGAEFVPGDDIVFTVRATDNTRLLRLEYSLDGGDWREAPAEAHWSPGPWTIDLTARDLSGGDHALEVRVTDQGGNTAEDEVSFDMDAGTRASGGDDGGSGIPGFGSAAAVALLAGAAVLVMLAGGRRRR